MRYGTPYADLAPQSLFWSAGLLYVKIEGHWARLDGSGVHYRIYPEVVVFPVAGFDLPRSGTSNGLRLRHYGALALSESMAGDTVELELPLPVAARCRPEPASAAAPPLAQSSVGRPAGSHVTRVLVEPALTAVATFATLVWNEAAAWAGLF